MTGAILFCLLPTSNILRYLRQLGTAEGWLLNALPHDIAVVHTNHTICGLKSSDDYHAIIVAVAPRIDDELKSLAPTAPLINYYHYIWQPDFHLTDEQQSNVIHLIQLLKSISESEIQNRETILKDLLKILAVLLQNYRHANGYDVRRPSTHLELAVRFHQAVVEHFRESREVRFYADLFCLTPKHFSTVIKEQTGTTYQRVSSKFVR